MMMMLRGQASRDSLFFYGRIKKLSQNPSGTFSVSTNPCSPTCSPTCFSKVLFGGSEKQLTKQDSKSFALFLGNSMRRGFQHSRLLQPHTIKHSWMASALISSEVKEEQELTSRWRPGRRVRGSLAVVKPLSWMKFDTSRQEKKGQSCWKTVLKRIGWWVKARVYSMS